MATMRGPSRQAVFGILTVSVFILFVTFWSRTPHLDLAPLRSSLSAAAHRNRPAGRPAVKQYGRTYRGRSSPADINRVANETLGFSKILVVGLPERTDKRDAIALTSSLTGFHVDWVDGVRGQSVPDKAVPFGVDRVKLWENNLGSWRGHMNAIQRIVQENLDSALIMEDDMDWDVRLKPQLERFAQGARSLLGSSSSPNSPYGNDWDVLWLGHCGEVFPELLDENKGKPAGDRGLEYMSRKFVISDDETVPPLDKVTGLVDFHQHPPHTRFVHPTAAPICTYAYALSQRGARKVLFDLSVDRLTGPFDNALAWLCRRAIGAWGEDDPDRAGDRGLDARCLSSTPPLFFHHKAKGRRSGDSDIQTVADDAEGGGGGGDVRAKGFTENIVWSARNNVRNMIMGLEMESQFEESATSGSR